MTNRIINNKKSDYHIHSVFSDWVATIEELVQFAGKIGMEEIAITDHSDHLVEILKKVCGITPSWGARYALKNRENVHNDVKVIFWVEWDVINEEWDVCLESQKIEGKFIILSVHRNGYLSNHETAWKWLINAIKRHHDKIDCIGHPHDKDQLWAFIDMKELVEVANQYNIPMEFNRGTFNKGKAIEDKLMYMLEYANKIYVNSDSHSLNSLKKQREECYNYLEKHNIH